jgi:hypothetical protein
MHRAGKQMEEKYCIQITRRKIHIAAHSSMAPLEYNDKIRIG